MPTEHQTWRIRWARKIEGAVDVRIIKKKYTKLSVTLAPFKFYQKNCLSIVKWNGVWTKLTIKILMLRSSLFNVKND